MHVDICRYRHLGMAQLLGHVNEILPVLKLDATERVSESMKRYVVKLRSIL